MIKDRTYHLTIGLVAEQGHESVCLVCFHDIVVFGEPGGALDVFEYETIPPGRDAGMAWTWDKRGRMDGWMALRPHVCTNGEKAP